MNCETARELLSARLDGALAAAEEEILREHFDACEGCRARAADLQVVVGLVREIPTPELRGSLAAEVVSRLPRKRRPAPIRWLVPLAAAACLLIVARLAFLESPVEDALEVASNREDQGDTTHAQARADEMPVPVTAAREKPEWLSKDGGPPPAPVAPQAVMDPGDDSSAGPPADAPAPGRTALRELEGGEKEDASRATVARTYSVRGAEPDSAAGVILAELRSRRSREGLRTTDGDERVVQNRSGNVAGMLLTLTPSEIEFVTCLLEERPGVQVARVNGGEKKRGDDLDKAPKKPAADADEEADAGEARVRVRLDFARR